MTSIDIYVIGTGIVGSRQMTLEGQAALEKSNRIYLAHHQETFKDYASQFSDDIVDLTDEYNEGEFRAKTYTRMADIVLEGAKTIDGPVTFALYGHPMVFVLPTRLIMERAPDQGIEVEVLPGISAADCLYIDLKLDPASQGLQMFEATDLLIREYDLNPHIPALIWQIGSLETALYATGESKPERFTRFMNYLQNYYPESQHMYLVRTATYPISNSEMIEFELGGWDEIFEDINPMQTLYIPPMEEKSVQNEELFELVKSEEYLSEITNAD